MQVRSPGPEEPLEEETATHSSILTWKIPWTEEPGGYSPWDHKELDTAEHRVIGKGSMFWVRWSYISGEVWAPCPLQHTHTDIQTHTHTTYVYLGEFLHVAEPQFSFFPIFWLHRAACGILVP